MRGLIKGLTNQTTKSYISRTWPLTGGVGSQKTKGERDAFSSNSLNPLINIYVHGFFRSCTVHLESDCPLVRSLLQVLEDSSPI